MAQKIPVYGELDCRTSENIIADAEQIRYYDTNVKTELELKMAEPFNAGTVGQVLKKTETGSEWQDESGGSANNMFVGTLRALCAKSRSKLTSMKIVNLYGTKNNTLFVDCTGAIGTSTKPFDVATKGLLLGTINSDNTFSALDTSKFSYDTTDEAFTKGFTLPCIIVSITYSTSSIKWVIYSYDNTTSKVKQYVISSKGSSGSLDSINLPCIIGAQVNASTNKVTDIITNTTTITKYYWNGDDLFFKVMPKFSIENISSTSNAQVISQHTVCEKYDSIYYRATHYFKLKATSTEGKIYLSGKLVLLNGATSVHTYVQDLYGFATFAGTDMSSTADNDYALSVVTTQTDVNTFGDNTVIGTVKIDSNSKFDKVGDTVNVMVVILFKSSSI